MPCLMQEVLIVTLLITTILHTKSKFQLQEMTEAMFDLLKLTLMLSSMAGSISKLTNFTKQRVTFNSLFSFKLNFIMELTERVKYLESTIVVLKSCLSTEVKALTLNYNLRQRALKNELFISGILTEIEDLP